jgi:hypothetical protein
MGSQTMICILRSKQICPKSKVYFAVSNGEEGNVHVEWSSLATSSMFA